MKDCELEDRVECLVAWFVDENPFVGDGSDDIVVDEVSNERAGPPFVNVRYHHAGGVLVYESHPDELGGELVGFEEVNKLSGGKVCE